MSKIKKDDMSVKKSLETKLFKKYEKIKEYFLDSRFNLLIKSFEEYRGEFASQCRCLKKD